MNELCCLHRDQRCKDTLHRCHESSGTTDVPTQNGLFEGFTKKYGLRQLVYFEQTDDISVAIEREKQLKGWRRARKIELIESTNPNWEDLAARWFPKPLSS